MIILLCGFKTSGKDTCANYVSQKYNFTHRKISQPLKDGLKVMFNFTDEQIEGKSKDVLDKQWLITPRDAMIYIGTDIFQYHIQKKIPSIGRNFWIKQLEQRITKDKDLNVIVSDLRFWHEHEYLKHTYSNDIITIKIFDPTLLIYQKDAVQSEIEHLQFKFDYIIENSKDERFFGAIDDVIDKILINQK